MSRYTITTLSGRWVNTTNSKNSACDMVKNKVRGQLTFNGIPEEEWDILGDKYIIINQDTRERFIVFQDGSCISEKLYKDLTLRSE